MLDDLTVLANPDPTTPVQLQLAMNDVGSGTGAQLTVPDGRAWEVIACGCQANALNGGVSVVVSLTAIGDNGAVIFTSPLPVAILDGHGGSASWGQDIFPQSVTADTGDEFFLASIPTGIILRSTNTVNIVTAGSDGGPQTIQVPLLVVNEFVTTGTQTPPVIGEALRAFAPIVAGDIASALGH